MGSTVIVVDPSVKMTRPRTVAYAVTIATEKIASIRGKRSAITALKESPLAIDTSHVYECENGFVGAFMLAYNHHLPLRLSPDVCWLTIMQSVATYIQDSGEAFRNALVTHAVGKVGLVVEVPAWEDADIEWESVLQQIQTLIRDGTQPGIADAFTPTFSTTTLTSTTAATVALMSALQNFFDYGMKTKCGLGEVYMEGTVEDWRQLRERVHALPVVLSRAGRPLFPWFRRLDATLASLVDTAERRPSVEFWQHAYSKTVVRGSGEGTFLSGWFLHFFNAGSTLLPSIRIEELRAGYVTVPFTWVMLGATRSFTLQAGTWTTQVSADGVASATPQWKVTEGVAESAAASRCVCQ
jgi:hypothetical protein